MPISEKIHASKKTGTTTSYYTWHGFDQELYAEYIEKKDALKKAGKEKELKDLNKKRMYWKKEYCGTDYNKALQLEHEYLKSMKEYYEQQMIAIAAKLQANEKINHIVNGEENIPESITKSGNADLSCSFTVKKHHWAKFSIGRKKDPAGWKNNSSELTPEILQEALDLEPNFGIPREKREAYLRAFDKLCTRKAAFEFVEGNGAYLQKTQLRQDVMTWFNNLVHANIIIIVPKDQKLP